MRELRGCTATMTGDCLAAATLNTRQIVFISPPDVKDSTNPRSGIGTAAANRGQYFDPWGKNYVIRIDGDYNNQVNNPYTANAGANPLPVGVIALVVRRRSIRRGGLQRQKCRHSVRRRDFVAVIFAQGMSLSEINCDPFLSAGRAGSPLHAVRCTIQTRGAHRVTRPTNEKETRSG